MKLASCARIVHHQLTYEQLRERLTAQVGQEFATLLADMDRAIAEGAEDRTTDAVQRLTGRRPHGFRTFAAREMTRSG